MTDQEQGIRAGQEFEVDMLCPEDAPGVAGLFREVYGEAYSIELVYHPDRLVEAHRRGDNICLVARTKKGDIVGHEAFYRSAPSPRAYELGQGVVLPSYRKQAIPARLQQYAFEVMAPSMDLDVAIGEPVCNHVFMQKSLVPSGLIPMALEVDLMPAEAYAKEGSARGRVSTLLSFRTYHPRPQTVYMPERYGDFLKWIYKGLDDERTLTFSPANANPTGGATAMTAQVFDFAQVVRVAVHEAGADFREAFETREREFLARGMAVIQVWLKLSWPYVGSLTEYLRETGYFFGGPLPQWFGDDGLLMQKVAGTPSWDSIQLHSDRAVRMVEYVKEDWAGRI